MVLSKLLMSFLLNEVPEFQSAWEMHQSEWNGEIAGLCNDMTAFADFTEKQIKIENVKVLTRIFILIEALMAQGEQEVKDIVATCFLENLLNDVSAKRIPANGFLSYLGPKSTDYCRAWDDFTGVITEGL